MYSPHALTARLIVVLLLLAGLAPAHAADNNCAFSAADQPSGQRYDIPVGLFVTNIYDLDFENESVTVSAWVWSTYDPAKLPADWVFFECIEIVNARSWEVNDIENFIIERPDGKRHAMAKVTAVLNQSWDTQAFPFDKQKLRLSIESVALDSTQIGYIPDRSNSKVSDDFKLSDWSVASVKLENTDYEYATSFGLGGKAVYPRIDAYVPMERHGTRIFITAFIGFFVAYIIIAGMVIFDKNMIGERVSQLMTALFAAIGNKTVIDYFPTQTDFSLSDLVQVATFTIIALALLSTVAFIQLVKTNRVKLAYAINKWVFIIIAPGYPLVIAFGLYAAINA